MKSKLIAYSMDFSSYLIQKLKDRGSVNNIILFGSVARGEEDTTSDIDIFIEVVRENQKLESEIKKILKSFLDSAKYNNYWKLLGISNEIQLTIGRLQSWKQLLPSLAANGISLYGKFMAETKGKHRVIFVWENIKPNAKRVLINKKLFGFRQKKYYDGLLQKYGGERLGKGCIIVPAEKKTSFHELFRKHKISVKIKQFVEY